MCANDRVGARTGGDVDFGRRGDGGEGGKGVCEKLAMREVSKGLQGSK